MCDSDGDSGERERENGALICNMSRDVTKMIIVGAGARFLFYPTLFYNVVRNKLEPEFRWWDEIDQFLLLGAVPFPGDIPRLKDAGVHAVVTLNEPYETLVHTSLYKDRGISHLSIPTRDYLFAPCFDDIRRAVQFIHEHAIRGERTYVHCKAGRGRSTTIVICYLVEYKGMTPQEALQYVRSKRPRVLLADAQWQAIQGYTIHCKRKGYSKQELITCDYDNKEDLLSSKLNNDEDLPVIVSREDLVGYRSIEDAGVIGNEIVWKLSNIRFKIGNILSLSPCKKMTSYCRCSVMVPVCWSCMVN